MLDKNELLVTHDVKSNIEREGLKAWNETKQTGEELANSRAENCKLNVYLNNSDSLNKCSLASAK